MTKEQIKFLVATKIEGQGTAVDAGSTLPAILNGIVDLMAESGESVQRIEVDEFEDFGKTTLYSVGDIVRHEGGLYRFTANKDAGEWDATKVEQVTVYSLLSEELPVKAATTISALESANLTAEQAAAAGFDALTIRSLQMADNPTVHFSDMCVTFNSVEVISDDLVNQSALIVHTAASGGELWKVILSLYTDGRVVYTATEIEL